MNIYTDTIIEGRPGFKNFIGEASRFNSPKNEQTINSRKVSFLSKNRLLSKNAPKSYSLFQKIGDWVWRVFRCLFTFVKRPDIYTETNLLLTSGKYSKESIVKLVAHYRNFFAGEISSPSGLKKCLDRFESDTKELEAWQAKAAVSTPAQKKIIENAKKAFISKRLSELKNLKDGEDHLFNTGGIAWLCSKNEGKFTLRLMGTFASMKVFRPQTLPLAGKTKVQRCVVFEKMPASALFDKIDSKTESIAELMLTDWSDAAIKAETPVTVLNRLASYRQEPSSLDRFKTSDERIDKVYWNVIGAIRDIAAAKQGSEVDDSRQQLKQVRLRAQLVGLFDFFRNERYALSVNDEAFFREGTFNDLKAMHKDVSADFLRAYRKGQLSKAEFEEVRTELDVIADALRKAAPPKSTFHTKQALKPRELPTVKLSMLGAKEISFSVDTNQTTNLKKAFEEIRNLEPPTLAPQTPIPLPVSATSPFAQIKTKEDFLGHLRRCIALPNNEKKEILLLKFFSEVPFAPYEGINVKDSASFWWDLTASEQKEVMEAIYRFASETFSGDEERVEEIIRELSQFRLDALIKMSMIVIFIESHTLKVKIGEFGYFNLKRYLIGEVDLIKRNVGYAYDSKRINIEHTYRKSSPEASLTAKELLNAYQSLDDQKFSSSSSKVVLEDSFSLRMGKMLHKIIKGGTPPHVYESENKYSLFDAFGDWEPKCLPNQVKKWIRPIDHPFLAALYRNAASFISPVDRKGNPILGAESFQTQPQAIFNEIKRIFEDLLGTSASGDVKEIDTVIFSKSEQQALLQILKVEHPQIALLGFMQEFPHLMKHASVRNYFDSLFFNSSLNFFLNECDSFNAPYLEKDVPEQIQGMIDRLESQLEDGLQNCIDEDLVVKRFETLIYFYEMKEKLRRIYESRYVWTYRRGSNSNPVSTRHFSPSFAAVERLRRLALTDNRFKNSGAAIARVHLTTILSGGQISPEVLPEVIFDYMLLFAGPDDSANSDPQAEEVLKNKWVDIAAALKVHAGKIPLDSIRRTLNYLRYYKGLSPVDEEWVPVPDSPLIYKAGDYIANLETMTVSLASAGDKTIEFLPKSVMGYPSFKRKFPELIGKQVPVHFQRVNNEAVYSFVSHEGVSEHVVLDTSGEPRYYRDVTVNGEHKRVQLFSPLVFKKISDAVMAETEKKVGMKASLFSNLLHGLGYAKGLFADAQSLLPPYFFEEMYIDPSNPSHGYKLNARNEILYEVVFKETRTGLTVDHVIDRRSGSQEPWQIHPGEGIAEIHCFTEIENPGQVSIWSQKGKIKKVELPRYGLSFAFEQGDWKCLNDALKGYKLVSDATCESKQGIEHSLLLRHPDPAMPKKLIVPGSECLTTESIQLQAVPLGVFGLIIYVIELMVAAIKRYLGRPGSIDALSKTTLAFGNSAKMSHTIYELRPYTDEICFKDKNTIPHLLNLASHALMTDKPVVALQMIRKMDLKAYAKDQKTLDLISRFIEKRSAGTPSENAVKFKLACAVYDALAHERKSTRSLRAVLRETMLEQARDVLQAGRKLPAALRLTSGELHRVAVIAKKSDREFYTLHLQPHLAAKETLLSNVVDESLFKEVRKDRKALKTEMAYDKHLEKLEAYLKAHPLTDADLSAPIPRSRGVPLLFDPKEVRFLFKRIKRNLPELKLKSDAGDSSAAKNALEEFQKDIDDYRKKEMNEPLYELKASPAVLKKFVDKRLKPKLATYSRQAAGIKKEIILYIRSSRSVEEQMAIYSGEMQPATLDALREGLTTNSIREMQESGSIPASVDLTKLQTLLTNYFDLLSRRHAAAASIRAINDLEHSKNRNHPVFLQSLSMSIYRMLTVCRYYDVSKDPRPVIFEAQQMMNFRCLDGGSDQLDLLDTLMTHPNRAIQAPTGAGKTSILSTMRSLMKANGKNLIIQKVTSPLYNQTYDKLKEVCGGLSGRLVYPLRFNLSMPMVETIIRKVRDDKGKEQEIPVSVSIFKRMYCEMMESIRSKGCVLTDYKSLPLIEEKFWKLNQEMSEIVAAGQKINDQQREHWIYLKNILTLIADRVDENMDEFDQPNRPINLIQTDLEAGSHPIPGFLVDRSVEVFEKLMKDPVLQLRKNAQGDLTEAMRRESIFKLAAETASSIAEANALDGKKLLNYFSGVNESIFEDLKECKDDDLLDRITLYKDQFSVYLPLTLRGKRKGKYARSDDGGRTVPCFNGVKHEAKPGTILEQINYAVQDYLQGGITAYDYRLWATNLKNEIQEIDPDSPRKKLSEMELERMLPGCTLSDLGRPESVDKHIRMINSDPAKIVLFLKIRLEKLKTSGAVISMNPQDIVNMNRVTSGMSATSGAPEALPGAFGVDRKQRGEIRANMALRVCQRAETKEVKKYDPLNPTEVIKEVQKSGVLSAIIDGAGVFNENPDAAIRQLLVSPKIKQVGYFKNNAMMFEGDATAEIADTATHFSQEFTRGMDVPMGPSARALFTLSADDSIGELFQKEGRLRLPTQRFVLAVSKYQTLTHLEEAISNAVKVEADLFDAKDIYRKCKQEIQAILRKEMRRKLLAVSSPEEFVAIFNTPEVHKLFVTPPAVHYDKPGDYYRAHRAIRLEKCEPKIELEALRAKAGQLAENLGLPGARSLIDAIVYPPELIAKMPKYVPAENAAELEMECEVEVEAEAEVEAEHELAVEIEVEKEEEKVVGTGGLINFPLRLMTRVEHALNVQTPIPYSDKIFLSDAFLPLSRDQRSLLKRSMWDGAMFRTGQLRLYFSDPSIGLLDRAVIDDPVENDVFTLSYGMIRYDLKTDKITEVTAAVKDTIARHMNSKEVRTILAQIKFMDGMVKGYTAEEILALKAWIDFVGKDKMYRHLMDTILRYRPEDRRLYEGSQLQQEVFLK